MRNENESSMNQGAVRIMEALSGVDEELLERCEKPVKTSRNKMVLFVQRYGKWCAACLCLAVLGSLYWGRMQQKPAGSSMENTSTGMMNEGVREMADGAYGMEGAPEECAESEEVEIAMYGEEPIWLDVESYAAVEALKQQQNVADSESTLNGNPAESGAEADDRGSLWNEITWEEARELAVLGSHVPVVLPEGYHPLKAKHSENESSLILSWTDDEYMLWLKLTKTDWRVNVRFDAEPPIFTVEEDWQNLIPEPGEDGSIRFALLFADGVLAEYQGYLTREQVITFFLQMFPFSSSR